MNGLATLIATMQRMQASYRKLARTEPDPSEALAQRAIADILGDLIRFAAEMEHEATKAK